MDAPCKIQGSIHVFRLVNNMCPGKWVHIKTGKLLFYFQRYDLKNGMGNDKAHYAGTDDSHKTGHHETVIQ